MFSRLSIATDGTTHAQQHTLAIGDGVPPRQTTKRMENGAIVEKNTFGCL